MSTNPSKQKPQDRLTAYADEGSLHKYRTEIPNTVIRGLKSRRLSLDAKWLYVYLKCVIGDKGVCYRTTTTIALESGLSRAAVSRAKQELLKARLIRIEKGSRANRDADRVFIRDIWPDNMQEFHTPSSAEDDEPSVSLGNTENGPELLEKRESNTPGVSLGNAEDSGVSLGNAANYTEVLENREESNVSVSLGNAEDSGVSLGNASVSLGNASVSLGNQRRSQEEDPKKKEENPSPLTPQGENERVESQLHTEHLVNFNGMFTEPPAGFTRVWDAYPTHRRDRQRKTCTLWVARNLEARTAEIMAKVERLKITQWVGRKPGQIPTLYTWIEEMRYDDPLVALDETAEGTDEPFETYMQRKEADHGTP